MKFEWTEFEAPEFERRTIKIYTFCKKYVADAEWDGENIDEVIALAAKDFAEQYKDGLEDLVIQTARVHASPDSNPEWFFKVFPQMMRFPTIGDLNEKVNSGSGSQE